jgi:DNA-binding Xre family transcriptional regulator
MAKRTKSRGKLATRLAKEIVKRRGDQTQMDFCKDLGISNTSLNRIEQGIQNVTLDTIEVICDHLECDICDLFCPTNPRAAPSRKDETI